MPPIQDDDDLTPDERDFEQTRAAAAAAAPAAPAPATATATAAATPGDDGEPAAAAPAPEPAPPAPAPAAAAAAEEPSVEDIEAVANDEPALADPVQYQVPDIPKLKEDRKALRTQEADIEKKWSAGEFSDEQKAEQIGNLRDKSDELLSQITRAETLAEANEQSRMAAQTTKLEAIKAAAKKDGTIDYNADQTAPADFNAALQLLIGNKANAGKSFDEIADKAHAMVCAMRGVAPKAAAAPTPAPAPAAPAPAAPVAPAKRDVPTTLASMPTAGVPPVSDDVMTQFGGIEDPDQAEAMLEAMPANRREALRRSTIAAGRH